MKFVLKDVKKLASLLISYFIQTNDVELNRETSKIYMDSLKQAKKDYKGNIKEIILEFYGGYILSANRQMCQESGLMHMIFTAPLNEMPLYIAGPTHEKIIAQWRLLINK